MASCGIRRLTSAKSTWKSSGTSSWPSARAGPQTNTTACAISAQTTRARADRKALPKSRQVKRIHGSPSGKRDRRSEAPLRGLRVIRLQLVHYLLLVELRAHGEHGVRETAGDLGDLLRAELVEDTDADLHRLRQGRPDAETLRAGALNQLLLLAGELARQVEHDQARHVRGDLAAHGLDGLTQGLLVIGVVGGLAAPAIAENDAQRLVERGDGVAGMGLMIAGRVHVLAVDDAPMAGVEDRVVDVGAAAPLLDRLDGLVGEAHRRVGQRQGQHALLRTRRPGDHARIIVDVEIAHAEAGHGIADAHHAMLEASIGEALEVVDAARAGLPMGHERPHRLVLGQRLVDGLSRDRLAVGRLDDGHTRGLRIEAVGGELILGGGLHADSEAVDAGEGAVREGHDLVARQDQAEHAIEPGEAGAGHAARGEALEHARVGVPRPGAGGKGLWDYELRKYGHGNTLCLAVNKIWNSA